MASGYDISLAASGAAKSGSYGSFSLTGGGGSSLSSTIKQAGQNLTATADQTPAGKWTTYALIGGVILLGGALVYLIGRKK